MSTNLVNEKRHSSRYGSVSRRRMISSYFSHERNQSEIGQPYAAVVLGRIFRLRERNTTVADEVKAGFVHFVSVLFIMAVNPVLLAGAGYGRNSVAAGTGVATGVACILSGLVCNLPFVIAPTTSTSLYYEIFLLNNELDISAGNFATFLLGVTFIVLSIRKVAVFTSNLVPFVLKAGICLGVGLLVALDALTSIHLVEPGRYTVLDMGDFTSKIWISILSFVIIALLMSRRVKGAFVIGIFFGSSIYWALHREEYPATVFARAADFSFAMPFHVSEGSLYNVARLVGDLLFIGVILLNGLAQGLSDMAGVRRKDGTTPRGKWLYALCGVGTIVGSFLGTGPLLISPESAPGLKAGAKSGLSVVVCGCLFLLSVAIGPLLASAPVTGTAPVLLMIGAILFENAQKVNWTDVRESVPIFLVTALVPFTYSLFYGVLCGLCMHVVFKVCSANFWRKYSPPWLVSYAGRCCACLHGQGWGTRDASGLYDHLRDEFGLHGPEEGHDDDDNRTEPLFFDNPYFDFHPSAGHDDTHSDDGSEFFGVSLRGMGMHSLNQADGEGDDGEEHGHGDDDDDEEGWWYHGVPLES